MKKLYITLFSFFLLTTSSLAQVQNQTVTDCNSLTKDMYSVLTTGKVLVVASKGFDCSICKSKAPGLQSWAASHKLSIEVWGAMTYTYNSNTPNCSNVNSWKSSYGWNDIFTFVDANRTWYGAGTPQYFVYDPADSTLAYQGFSESTARTTAQNLSNPSIGIQEVKISQKTFFISQSDGYLQLHNLPSEPVDVQIFDLTGKVVKSQKVSVNGDIMRVSITNFKSGLYLVKVKGSGRFEKVKKFTVQ